MIPCCPTSGSALAESPNRPKDSNASNVQKLKIEFTGSKLGIFRCIAKVSLSGQSDRIIDIHANVVEHRLEIVLPDGGGQISSVPFGSLYYGQERTILAILVNNGPNSAAYQATLNIDDSKSKTDSHSDILEDASANTPAPKPDLTVTPYEGVIAPYAQTTFTFHYKPKKPRMPTGFATTSNFDWSPVPLKAQLQIESSGIQQQLQVDISGQAVYPQIEVSQRSFDFGKCAFGDRVDMLVTIKNAGVLPATFALNQVAHFRCRPSKGKLESMQSLTAVMSFVPAQLGAFHNTLHLVVGKDNLQKIMIKCRGEAQVCASLYSSMHVSTMYSITHREYRLTERPRKRARKFLNQKSMPHLRTFGLSFTFNVLRKLKNPNRRLSQHIPECRRGKRLWMKAACAFSIHRSLLRGMKPD